MAAEILMEGEDLISGWSWAGAGAEELQKGNSVY